MRKTNLLLSLLVGSLAFSQSNPVKWTFSSRKVSDKTYEIVLAAAVRSPWHIYSQFTPEGGPVPTEITFNKNPIVTLSGQVQETGKLITKFEDVFSINVKYFEGEAKFVQMVTLKASAKTTISGTVKFMVCNDVQCLAPKEVPFSVALQ